MGKQLQSFILIQQNFLPIFKNGSLTLTEKDIGTLKQLSGMIVSAAASASSPVSIAQTSGKNIKKPSDFFRRFACKLSNSNNNRRKSTSMSITGQENTPNLCTTVAKSSVTFRKTTLVNNDRGDGRRHGSGRGAPGQARKTSKQKRKCTCTFGFKLKVDEFGFYINTKNKSGNSEHVGHPLSLH